MIDVAVLKAVGAGAVALIAGVGAVYSQFTPRADFDAYTAAEAASDNRALILSTVKDAAAEPAGAYKDSLCRGLDEAIDELCSIEPEGAICMDRAVYREKAGCT